MSLRDVEAKKLYRHHFNRLRPGLLAASAALILAACGGVPVTVVPDPSVPPAPGGVPTVPADPAAPGLPGAPSGTGALPPVITAPPGTRPMPAPVARPGNKPAVAANRNFVRGTWQNVPGWQTDDMGPVWNTFLENCRSILLRTGRPVALAAPQIADPYAWQQVCAASRELRNPVSHAQMRSFLEKWLEPWSVRAASGEAASSIATGYYEPLVTASRVRGGVYQWPLYAVPADLLTIDLGSLYPELAGKRVRGKLDGKRVVPYDTRTELTRPGREPAAIVWVNDPVDAFFLQVQGSGRASLDEGNGRTSLIRVAYADHNGHPYVSIGRWLVDQGELTMDQASMQSIKAWAQRNPNRVREMLNANPAMVFFREEAIAYAEEGPKGAFGVPLTAQRSIAIDPSIVPLGTPVFLATTLPNSRQPMQRLMFAQDTGAAIKGAARADVYWGSGDAAGEMAGRMKQASRMWALWPKGEGAPTSAR